MTNDQETIIKTNISSLNKARIGALGEYIYTYYLGQILNCDIRSTHKNDTDFVVNGEPVDVKTRGFGNETLSCKRKVGIIYSFVCFSQEQVTILFKDKIYNLGWRDVVPLWEMWIKKEKIIIGENSPDLRKVSQDAWKEIKVDIIESFQKQGIKALKVIQRTKRFNGESPGNLMSKLSAFCNPSECCRVYVEFKGYPIRGDNVDMIFAFPETHLAILPRLTNFRLKSGLSREEVDKIDLKKMPPCYVFKNIPDLMANYKIRFSTFKEGIA